MSSEIIFSARRYPTVDIQQRQGQHRTTWTIWKVLTSDGHEISTTMVLCQEHSRDSSNHHMHSTAQETTYYIDMVLTGGDQINATNQAFNNTELAIATTFTFKNNPCPAHSSWGATEGFITESTNPSKHSTARGAVTMCAYIFAIQEHHAHDGLFYCLEEREV